MKRMDKEYIEKEKFKHLFKGGLDYESPIRLIETDIYTQMRKQQENDIFETILKYGVDVDKEELIKALKYDRGQYEKGYADAMASIVHCKDCKHYREGKCFTDIKFCFRLKDKDGDPIGYSFSDDDYCSYGERME